MSTKRAGAIARHFTTRRLRGDSESKRNAPASIRSQISSPVELVHTTNLLSYNAPDIQPRSGPHASAVSTRSTRSTSSDSDADSNAPTVASNASSPPTSPDVAHTPGHKPSPEANHVSTSSGPHKQATTPIKPSAAPLIPRRARTHTKKSSETTAREPSISSLSNKSATSKAGLSFSRSSSASTNPSHSSMASTHSAKPSNSSVTVVPPASVPQRVKEATHNPFGQELEKVTEIAEEFGVKDRLQATNSEDMDLREKGLCKFEAEDYIAEIQHLITGFMEDMRPPTQAAAWI